MSHKSPNARLDHLHDRETRGSIYCGPIYSAKVADPTVCLKCIADGSAAAMWEATFTDVLCWSQEVPGSVANEVLRRTPGFNGWQQEHWIAHCGDAAIFLGPVGANELAQLPQQATDALLSGQEITCAVSDLDRSSSPTGYVFRCRHCNLHLGYIDFD